MHNVLKCPSTCKIDFSSVPDHFEMAKLGKIQVKVALALTLIKSKARV